MIDSAESTMTCQEFVELVTEYLEGTLSASDHLRVEAHLAVCEGCRNYLEQMRLTIRMLGRLDDGSTAAIPKDELLRRFRELRRGPLPGM